MILQKTSLAPFAKTEDGSITILSLFMVLLTLVIGGLAVDFNRVMADRTRLQFAADTAAHGALYVREKNNVSEAKQAGTDIISDILPSPRFAANTLTTADVSFGRWDKDKLVFTEDPGSRSAARVFARMTEERGSASRNYLLQIIGFDTFDLNVQSIYSTYYPPCFTEGFVAEQEVRIRSSNNFYAPFCIHSNQYVSMGNGNSFQLGTEVSMPDTSLLNASLGSNGGLGNALKERPYRMRLLANLPEIINSFWSVDPHYLPTYIAAGSSKPVQFDRLADGSPSKHTNGKLTPAHFEKNSVNYLNCPGNSVTLESGTYLQILFITDCMINFAQGARFEDAVIATTNTSPTSMNSPSGLSVGRADNCATGGGAVLMTLGGFKAAAGLQISGGQILAKGDIEFSANADGVKGASLVSGRRIDSTSEINMGGCNHRGMEAIYRAPFFRMVN